MGRLWDMSNMDCEPGESKWLAKGNTEEISHKSNTNYPKGATQKLSLCLSLSVCLSTYSVLCSLLNTLFASLLSIFVEIIFCKAKRPGSLSLTIGLVASIYCFHHCDPAQAPSKPLQAEAIWGHIYFNFSENSCMIMCLQASLPSTLSFPFQVKHLRFILNFFPFSTSIIQSISNFFFLSVFSFQMYTESDQFSILHAILWSMPCLDHDSIL